MLCIYRPTSDAAFRDVNTMELIAAADAAATMSSVLSNKSTSYYEPSSSVWLVPGSEC
jgi:hypothetical protein